MIFSVWERLLDLGAWEVVAEPPAISQSTTKLKASGQLKYVIRTILAFKMAWVHLLCWQHNQLLFRLLESSLERSTKELAAVCQERLRQDPASLFVAFANTYSDLDRTCHEVPVVGLAWGSRLWGETDSRVLAFENWKRKTYSWTGFWMPPDLFRA